MDPDDDLPIFRPRIGKRTRRGVRGAWGSLRNEVLARVSLHGGVAEASVRGPAARRGASVRCASCRRQSACRAADRVRRQGRGDAPSVHRARRRREGRFQGRPLRARRTGAAADVRRAAPWRETPVSAHRVARRRGRDWTSRPTCGASWAKSSVTWGARSSGRRSTTTTRAIRMRTSSSAASTATARSCGSIEATSPAGMRWRAQEIATQELGPRHEFEIRRAHAREITQERFTSLDRELERLSKDGRLELRSPKPRTRMDPSILCSRLEHLEAMGLAERLSSNAWSLLRGLAEGAARPRDAQRHPQADARGRARRLVALPHRPCRASRCSTRPSTRPGQAGRAGRRQGALRRGEGHATTR